MSLERERKEIKDLVTAAGNNDADTVIKITRSSPSIVNRCSVDKNALSVASVKENVQMVAYLVLKAGANPNAKCGGETILQRTNRVFGIGKLTNDQQNILRILKNEIKDFNFTGPYATAPTNTEMVRKPTVSEDIGAALSGGPGLALNGGPKSPTGKEPIDIELLLYVIHNADSPYINGYKVKEEKVLRMIHDNPIIATEEVTYKKDGEEVKPFWAILSACFFWSTRIIKALLDAGADLNVEDKTVEVRYDGEEILHVWNAISSVCLRPGQSDDMLKDDGDPMTTEEIEEMGVKILQMLFDKGAKIYTNSVNLKDSVNLKNFEDQLGSIMQYKRERLFPGMIKILIDHGANPNIFGKIVENYSYDLSEKTQNPIKTLRDILCAHKDYKGYGCDVKNGGYRKRMHVTRKKRSQKKKRNTRK
ncbi:MAG: hypothetical protein EB127_12725 [Alphaproteobacteria bacterium]|nr:hypothetical protein [Alphaproteobacteria bacterium]